MGLKEEINKGIPQSAVREREGPGGVVLSYVDGHYVFSQMNELFGPLGWGYESEIAHVSDSVDKRGRVVVYAAARATAWVRDRSASDDHWNDGWHTTDYGSGNGCAKSYGDAHEAAIKEAVTDAVKRCCRSLGPRLGLALYDRDRVAVYDDSPDDASLEERIRTARTLGALRRTYDGVLDLQGTKDYVKFVALYRAKKEELEK